MERRKLGKRPMLDESRPVSSPFFVDTDSDSVSPSVWRTPLGLVLGLRLGWTDKDSDNCGSITAQQKNLHIAMETTKLFNG